jgi:uncharacterized protein with ParB-like and HNH nuclease domain
MNLVNFTEMQEIKKVNIKTMLESDNYKIPLYQRNFAWGENEINQLLDDIQTATKERGEIEHYFLGTVVVSKSEDQKYYVITDGQQRFTVLSIINAVIKNYLNSQLSVETCNLDFEAREKTRAILEELHNDVNSYNKIKEIETADAGTVNILNAVDIIEHYFSQNLNSNKEEFVNYFYNNVMLFISPLPKYTDLNHYFEVMNNRGEQLEKHEILKAAFISNIKPKLDKIAFAKIWDACSIMNSHVQDNFDSKQIKDKEESTVLFGVDWTDIPSQDAIEEYKKLFKQENEGDGNSTDGSKNEIKSDILSIINNHTLPKDFNQKDKSINKDKFSSIIDFPNFLLHVLSLSKEEQGNKVRLDDKFLLEEFGYPHQLPDSMGFIRSLLKLRILFDRYVIKREEDEVDWNWSLSQRIKNDNYYEASLKNDDCRRKLRVLHSMLHVSFPSNIYKNWLQYFLRFLYQQESFNDEWLFINSLKKYIKNYWMDIFRDNVYSLGTNTPRFLFNLLDFILWEIYYDQIRGGDDNKEDDKTFISKIALEKQKFAKFKFVQRSSVEHLFPQSRLNELIGDNMEDKRKTLDCFGNLCLVSRSSNSFFGKNMPIQKKHDSKRNESLKQTIMFSSFNNEANDIEKWNKKEIELHDKEMRDVINSYINAL